MTCGRILLFVLLSCSCAHLTLSQSTPLKGVVWDARIPPTAADLVKMREAGIEAMRLPLLADPSLLAAADTLGLQLFQDLPVMLLPARSLLDTLVFSKRQLNRARQMSLLHPSAQHFGVSTKSDTSDPRACDYFEELKEWAPDLTLYYTSTFVDQDACGAYVDLVLFDLRQNVDPATALKDWPNATPAGIASIGQPIDPETYGLRQPFSPESQARFLEDHLPPLLQSKAQAIFIYRWHDDINSQSQWGLLDASGNQRPAFDVMKGMYTGTQQVFAFDFGERPRPDIPWPLILGWITCLIVVCLSIWYRNFPHVMLNYIMNLYPHRETLYREGALLGGISFIFVIAQGILVSATVLVLVEACRDLRLIEAIAVLMSPYLIDRALYLTQNTYLMVLVVVTGYLMIHLISSTLGAWGARQAEGIPIEHFFVINAMNHTPFGAMVPFVMVSPGLNPRQLDIVAIVLAFIWILLSIYCTLHSAHNFAALARNRWAKIGVLGLFIVPLLVVVGCILLLVIPGTREYIIFWWHLSFRT